MKALTAIVLAGALGIAAPALADDELDADELRRRGHMLYGNTGLRIIGAGHFQSGTNPTETGAGIYSRVLFGLAFEGGYLGLFTSLGTLQGIEVRVAAGFALPPRYAEPPTLEPKAALLLRADALWHFVPRFLRFNTWRVAALTGLGLEVDGNRWSDTWRAYANLGLRLQVFFSKESSASLSWLWMPGTLNRTFTLRTHHAELLVAVESVHVGLRGQLDFTGSTAGAGLAWQAGLVAGYAF
ncbi:MAG: hypothetical protein JNJ54_12255 [Myxococcaceae bacterium]|nr:hypothetical protein [Myxococcaceae bacterium]